jgi:hypothetical protein
VRRWSCGGGPFEERRLTVQAERMTGYTAAYDREGTESVHAGERHHVGDELRPAVPHMVVDNRLGAAVSPADQAHQAIGAVYA